jgi:hypothetical protein
MDRFLDHACNWLAEHHRITAALIIGLCWAASAYAGGPL